MPGFAGRPRSFHQRRHAPESKPKSFFEIWNSPHVSASHEILPEIREFERFSTTALNAYLQPEVSGYLNRLESALKDGGFDGEFMIGQRALT